MILGIDLMILEIICGIGMMICMMIGDIFYIGGIIIEDRGEDGVNGDGGVVIIDYIIIIGFVVIMDIIKVIILDIVIMGS